jgi:hypothetical protein
MMDLRRKISGLSIIIGTLVEILGHGSFLDFGHRGGGSGLSKLNPETCRITRNLFD